MRKDFFRGLLVILILVVGITAYFLSIPNKVQGASPESVVTGKLVDPQGQPIEGAIVSIDAGAGSKELSETTSQADGSYELAVPDTSSNSLVLHIHRVHFKDVSFPLDTLSIQRLRVGEAVVMPEVALSRQIGLAFWISTLVFITMLILIATGKLHNTLAALTGAALIFVFSYLGRPVSESLFIFNFTDAVQHVDWTVIFLVMGMMIVVAMVEATGLFQWLAFKSYRLSGGRIWLLLPILMLFTGIASAFLDNVTTMLLMTPISIQIGMALGINPIALLIPEVLASNVVGISTLIGTPTNILIGSFGHISFNAFMSFLTPGVLLALIGLIFYCERTFQKELTPGQEQGVSTLLLERLEQRARITQPDHLKKSAIVGAGMLLLFIFGEKFNLTPAVTAFIGATALLVWIRPDIKEMIEAVDWTTLVFFIALFIVVGAIQEVGLISLIADFVSRIVGNNLALAMLVITGLSALLSTVIPNIPFTAAMLPVVGYLTATIPGADSKVLFFCLSIGSAMGGNGSLIGASANMVVAGISYRAGYPITYTYFFKKGLPALLITVGLALAWLFIRFLWIGGSAG